MRVVEGAAAFVPLLVGSFLFGLGPRVSIAYVSRPSTIITTCTITRSSPSSFSVRTFSTARTSRYEFVARKATSSSAANEEEATNHERESRKRRYASNDDDATTPSSLVPDDGRSRRRAFPDHDDDDEDRANVSTTTTTTSRRDDDEPSRRRRSRRAPLRLLARVRRRVRTIDREAAAAFVVESSRDDDNDDDDDGAITDDSSSAYARALRRARSIETRRGLNDPRSRAAWKRVDELYEQELERERAQRSRTTELEACLMDVRELCRTFEETFRELEKRHALLRSQEHD